MHTRSARLLIAPQTLLSITLLSMTVLLAGPATAASPCPGTRGCTPKAPSGRGVKVGVIIAGVADDHGPNASLLAPVRAYAKRKGWKLVVTEQVAAPDAAAAAQALCLRGVAFVGLADPATASGASAAADPGCRSTTFYVDGNPALTRYTFSATAAVGSTELATGYATGLVMQAGQLRRGAFIGGPDTPSVTRAYSAWTAGIHQVVPDAATSLTFTGDPDDTTVAHEAATAQITAGTQILYPYLAGATTAVAAVGSAAQVHSVAPPGADQCGANAFVVATVFPPGDVMAQALQAWSAGRVRMGRASVFTVGVDRVPSIAVCPGAPDRKALQAKTDRFVRAIAAGRVDPNRIIDRGH